MHRILECPLCFGKELIFERSCKDYTATGETFDIVRCASCDVRITSPRPDPDHLGKYYQSNSYVSHSDKPSTLLDALYHSIRSFALQWKYRLIKEYSLAEPTSVLDFGSGTGDFLKVCQSKGLQVSGVEPSEKARTISRHRNGISVNERLDSGLTAVDIITAWHVLEHVPDITNTLNALRHCLKENGTMFIAVPNPLSADAKKYGSHWAGYDVPRHLWHFSKESMIRALEQTGFSCIGIEPMKLDAYYVSLLSEKYMKGKLTPLNMAMAAKNGFTSNMKAKADNNHSSLIYIARKK
jgi:2-polyprenyl-3-methyl-5-hydroxy-6-metoxy-1,4-benzoquinol methylase